MWEGGGTAGVVKLNIDLYSSNDQVCKASRLATGYGRIECRLTGTSQK